MSEYVQWGEVPSSGENSDFLKLISGNTYKIRPILDPVMFYKYFHKGANGTKTAICAKPDICPVIGRHPELKPPQKKYAAYVIDRADGKVKILEAPMSVFTPIGATGTASGKNPGSFKDGSDFQIKKTGAQLATKYEVAYAGQTPLDEHEIKAVKDAMDGDKKKLQKIYKALSSEEIEAKLFGPPAGTPAAAPAPAPAPASAPASAPEAVSASADSSGDWESNF